MPVYRRIDCIMQPMLPSEKTTSWLSTGLNLSCQMQHTPHAAILRRTFYDRQAYPPVLVFSQRLFYLSTKNHCFYRTISNHQDCALILLTRTTFCNCSLPIKSAWPHRQFNQKFDTIFMPDLKVIQEKQEQNSTISTPQIFLKKMPAMPQTASRKTYPLN